MSYQKIAFFFHPSAVKICLTKLAKKRFVMFLTHSHKGDGEMKTAVK